jgi:hypothetical protein
VSDVFLPVKLKLDPNPDGCLFRCQMLRACIDPEGTKTLN